MSDRTPVALDRQQYVAGQRLRSRDLRDQVAAEAELRWWHNRALHNAFGIAEGLAVQLVPRPAQAGATVRDVVRVRAGLAYDVFGRELILELDADSEAPEISPGEPQALLLTHRAGRSAADPYACASSAAGTSTRSARLVWKATRTVELRDGVPLAKLRVDPRQRAVILEPSRYRTRPLARPHVASGRTLAQDWLVLQVGARREIFALQVGVDFSAAGFTTAPCCLASLQGPRVQPNLAQPEILLFADHVEDLSSHGFTYVMYAMSRTGDGAAVRRFAAEQELSVCWLAVEAPCDPGRRHAPQGARDGIA